MRMLRVMLIPICTILIGACAQTRILKTEIYEDRRTGVALRKVVGRDGIPFDKGYSHPVQYELEDLKYLLRTIRYQEKGLFGWSDAARVFTANELYRLGPHLVDAFGRSSPDDEVLFRLTTAKRISLFASERFTNGAMFVEGRKLHVLFGNVNSRSDPEDIYDGNPRNYYAGHLWKITARGWQKLKEGAKGTHYNWIEIDWEQGVQERRRRLRAVERQHKLRQLKKTEEPRQETDWEDWMADEALEEEASEQHEDVYFAPD